jgi:hypothetical protein
MEGSKDGYREVKLPAQHNVSNTGYKDNKQFEAWWKTGRKMMLNRQSQRTIEMTLAISNQACART